MPPSRYIRLTEEEDVRLRQIEQAPHYFKPKVRLRAQVLRLSHRGSNVRTISAYTCVRWATLGSAPATCLTNRQTLMRSAKPPKSWRVSKKGSRRRDRPEVPRRERLLFVPAPDLHLDAKRHALPASGKKPMGVRRTDQPHRHAVLLGRGNRAVGVLLDRGFVSQWGGQGLPGRSGRADPARGQALRGCSGQRAVSHRGYD